MNDHDPPRAGKLSRCRFVTTTSATTAGVTVAPFVGATVAQAQAPAVPITAPNSLAPPADTAQQEGNFDLVGNNIPIFFSQNAIKLPDGVYAAKPEADREIAHASITHDAFWDPSP